MKLFKVQAICKGQLAESGEGRGWSLRKKGEKKYFLGTQSKALAGWPKRLRLVQATP